MFDFKLLINFSKPYYCAQMLGGKLAKHYKALLPASIGVGAQSTWEGGFLRENYAWKINKMPEFYMIIDRKIIFSGFFSMPPCLPSPFSYAGQPADRSVAVISSVLNS